MPSPKAPGPAADNPSESRSREVGSGASSSVEASFEQAIGRLGQIVEQLEGGDLPLEASLALFEEGIALTRASQKRLDVAEKRIEELLGVDDEGQAVTRPFDTKLGQGE